MKKFDVEIERAVLGEVLAYEEHRSKISLLNPDDFDAEEHRVMFRVMRKQFEEKGAFDFLTVANECGESYRTEIQSCVQVAISAGLFDEHFRLLKEMSSRRRLIKGVDMLSWSGEISTASLQALIDDENSKKISNSAQEQTAKSIDEFTENLNKSVDLLATGFPTVDRVIGGLRSGTVFIIGARPSTGKTALALNIAANQINAKKKTMFFSLEMTAEMIWERIMAARLDVDYKKFSQNKLDPSDVECIKLEAEKFKQDDTMLVIEDAYNVELICNMIRENNPKLAVVDFMQVITATGKFENTRGRIDYISSMFKRTAKDTGCVILVLSQLSRAGKDAPTMSDLKESGGLEQDGDLIALIHRPYVLNKGDKSIAPEQTELMLDKNKFGAVGKVDLWFDLKHQKFHEIDSWHESKVERDGAAFDGVSI